MYQAAADALLFMVTSLIYLKLQTNISKETEEESRKGVSIDFSPFKVTNCSKVFKNSPPETATSIAKEELLFGVTEDNTPLLEPLKRSQVRKLNLWHRATYCVVRYYHRDDANNNNNNNEEEECLIIQKRAMCKDYCPGLLDAAPGGMVQFGESYEENVERELEEELGVVKDETLRRLFSFSYVDNKCRVWGDMWDVEYKCQLSNLVLQAEEVEEVLCVPLQYVQELFHRHSDEELGEYFMPDGVYALRLYLQYRHDESVKRRVALKHGFSSIGSLDNYQIRPKPQAIFFDCDDCLYFDGWVVANRLTKKIDEWCTMHGLREGEAYELYKRHGTAIKGLIAEGHLEAHQDKIDKFLEDVHDLPISSMLPRDEDLRKMLLSIDPSIPKYIFTASVRHHAERCLNALGISDLFVDIIDTKACGLVTKHSTEAFEVAMRVANVTDPSSCVFLDDSVKNINAASRIGWRCILVGLIGRDCGSVIDSQEMAEHEIGRIHDLRKVMPELFM